MILKTIHVGCALLSLAGFSARGLLMLHDSPLLQARWVRIAPHVVDTVLLGSAIGLTLRVQQYPFVHDWLTAKVLALALYIGLGMVALRGRGKAVRTVAWVGALLVFGYILAVARTHSPMPWRYWP